MLCALAALWAVAIYSTGGFVIRLDSVRITSRSPLNPALIALLSGMAAWALARTNSRRVLREDLSWASAGLRGLLHESWRWVRWAGPAGLIALAATMLAIYQWSVARPLWLDEEMIALNLRDRPLSDLASPLWLGQSAPLGWLALQRVVVLAGGTSEYALRLVPVLFGIATLAVALWAGRRWMGTVGAAVLVLLCSVGTWMSLYQFDVKHYSADTFWALLLLALAAWTTDAHGSSAWTRRVATWWAAAAAGQWLANGALLIVPGCALVLLVMSWRRHGQRAAVTFTLLGVVWLASFGLNYVEAMRHTLNSEFLRTYWASSLPSASIGLTGTLGWLGARFEPLALNPIDSRLWVMFWIAATCGFAFSAHRPLGVLLATAPLSAFVLAAARIVPLGDRLSLWVVPALYFGVALFIDRGVRLARDGYGRRDWMRVAAAGVMLFVGYQLCSDIFTSGKQSLQVDRASDSNRGLDDRSAVRWLMGYRQPGDVLLTTRLALPAIWWYGEIPLSGIDSPGSRHPDGSRVFEVGYAKPGAECESNQLQSLLQGQHRVLVYSGFPDMPTGFDVLLFDSLDELGVITARRDFALMSRAAVVDVSMSQDLKARLARPQRASRPASPKMLDGCVVIRPAGRW